MKGFLRLSALLLEQRLWLCINVFIYLLKAGCIRNRLKQKLNSLPACN